MADNKLIHYGIKKDYVYNGNYKEEYDHSELISETMIKNSNGIISEIKSEWLAVKMGTLNVELQSGYKDSFIFKISLCGFNYSNYLYKIEAVIKMRDYFFCLERFAEEGMNPPGPESWKICVFHGLIHYTLGKLVGKIDKIKSEYISFVLKNYLGLFFPEYQNVTTNRKSNGLKMLGFKIETCIAGPILLNIRV